VGIFLSSCLGSKFLEGDQQILASQRTHGLTGRLEEDAEILYQQNRNTRFFGLMAHLAYIYKIGENGIAFIPGYDKQKAIAQRDSTIQKFDRKIANTSTEKKKKHLREKKIRKVDRKKRKVKEGNQTMRWGEKLAIYDHNKTRITAESIRQLLNSRGYFNASVEIDTIGYDSLNVLGKVGKKIRNGLSKKKGKANRYVDVNYYVNKGSRYYIDSIQYVFEDTVLYSLISKNQKDAPLKKGFYSQSRITAERDFIYETAVNNGYYEFSKQYISFQLDSIQLGKDTLIIREMVRNPLKKDQHKIFYLDSILFTSNADEPQIPRTSEEFREVTFNFGKDRYSKKILEWRIPLKQDDRYSRELTIETQRQLSYLDNFKTLNINYDTTGGKFIANIYTTPFEKYQTSSEFGLSTSQGSGAVTGNPGPFFNINLKNRNTFNALEIINIDAYAKLQDIQNAGDEISKADYTSIQYGGSIGVDFPQFLFPLGRFYKKKMGQFNPRTKLTIGLSYENRDLDYVRRISSVGFSYAWQVKDKTRFTFTPVKLSLINSDNTETFEQFLDETRADGNSYANSFLSAFVNTTTFQLNKNIGDYSFGQDGGFIGASAELGGHFNGLLRSTLGENLEYYRFTKANIDLRKIENVSRKLNLAYRLNVGVAIPNGLNNSLPYDKYLFAGGGSSVRAWKPRRLGPGAFSGDSIVIDGTYRIIDDQKERQGGEVLIETSIELRRALFGFVDGAIFLDAGNIWLLKGSIKADEDGDDGQFRWDQFMEEMAVGTGVGLRFDFSFLVFRVDLGLKLFDPAQKKGDRFVGDEIFRNFMPNSEINIGIGYPF
jgi:outer membrane protein insertion porin family